ncbi:hypothetical protein T02_3013 [Trichinella nativa]|uniref:Uncharacterized protein n=2 Tax=Trichinella TaxID=6333 RepID=A0A0V1LIC0_9BILA|nr:hypothetical protein T05_7288 [Trichinella murrelli]KRZ59235.1 hypothetical protein T02_3013 [Trichinella nativa]
MINSSRAQFSALGWAALELGENKRFPLVTAEQQGRGCGVEPNLNGPTNNFDFQFAKTTPTSGRHILAYSDEPKNETLGGMKVEGSMWENIELESLVRRLALQLK